MHYRLAHHDHCQQQPQCRDDLLLLCVDLQVQRLFFKHVHKLRDLALANCGSVEKRDTLRKYLNLLEPQELKFLVTQQLR